MATVVRRRPGSKPGLLSRLFDGDGAERAAKNAAEIRRAAPPAAQPVVKRVLKAKARKKPAKARRK
jgi:hypothetical protein